MKGWVCLNVGEHSGGSWQHAGQFFRNTKDTPSDWKPGINFPNIKFYVQEGYILFDKNGLRIFRIQLA